MPELPEVETIVRTLAPHVIGRRLQNITVLLPKSLQCAPELLPTLRQGRIKDIRRRAKLLLMTVEREADSAPVILAFHLKMTGSFFVHPPKTPPLKHTRIIFDLDDGRLFFDDMRTFGYCRAMLPEEMAQWDFLCSLGPEPLEDSVRELAEKLSKSFLKRKTSVKAALLDQSVIAGVGNIYADESLFKAGIRPDAKVNTLDSDRIFTLAEAIRDILALSIKECGSSIRDYKDANGNAGAFQNSFAVYGRKGERCTACQTPLVATKIAGRGTVYCPRCQT